jgi:CubicO group peptidase (beta-lactamase class C family)
MIEPGARHCFVERSRRANRVSRRDALGAAALVFAMLASATAPAQSSPRSAASPQSAASTPSAIPPASTLPTQELLEPALATAASLPRLRSLLVSRNGNLLLERYFNGAGPDDLANIKSASKSIISALIGIAIDRGSIASIDQPISDFLTPDELARIDADKRRITIGNLLTMQSGLETTSNRNYGAWVLSPNWIEFTLSQPLEAAPGTVMTYSTGNTHLLSAIITRATASDTLAFARETLAGPLGFRLPAWPRDPQGIYFGGNDMELTPRQMLAFGELYLNGGRHGERQIVSAAWVEASLRRYAESTREEGRYYGLGWWARDMAGIATHYAWGYGGQFILLAPDLDLVVVTTSTSQPGDDRRPHTRRMYDLVEYDVIAPLAAADGPRASEQPVSLRSPSARRAAGS